VGGRTEDLIMTTERCTCTHKRRFTCLLHIYRHDIRAIRVNGRGLSLYSCFVSHTHIPSQRVRIRREREKWLLEIHVLSLRCRSETDYDNAHLSKVSRRSSILPALLPLFLFNPVVDLQVCITFFSSSNACQSHPLRIGRHGVCTEVFVT
jgi:hypothetical protein